MSYPIIPPVDSTTHLFPTSTMAALDVHTQGLIAAALAGYTPTGGSGGADLSDLGSGTVFPTTRRDGSPLQDDDAFDYDGTS